MLNRSQKKNMIKIQYAWLDRAVFYYCRDLEEDPIFLYLYL